MKKILMGMAALAATVAVAQQSEIAKWNSAMAQKNAVVDPDGVKWIDGRYLPMKGPFGDDFEGAVDGCHSNDLGMKPMARAFGGIVRQALKL